VKQRRHAVTQRGKPSRSCRRQRGSRPRRALDSPQAVGLVQASGWNVDEVMSLRDAANTLVPRETGLPTDVVNEHKTLIAAAHAA
jgi:hypothetical protein